MSVPLRLVHRAKAFCCNRKARRGFRGTEGDAVAVWVCRGACGKVLGLRQTRDMRRIALGVSLPASLYARLENLADREGTTRNEVVRTALEAYLAEAAAS